LGIDPLVSANGNLD
jgi:hypothetical protein